MKNKIQLYFKTFKKIVQFLLTIRNANISYSQEGEDLILKRMFENKSKGFYIDVGAHHPIKFSNTYLFYNMGWSGINIEPNPSVSSIFKLTRKRDINITVGVSDVEGEFEYYYFNEPALNTFSKEVAFDRTNNTNYKIINTESIAIRRLDSILKEHTTENQKIDFLTIDVEGYDLNVLKSNSWNKYRPSFVLVEILNTSIEEIYSNEIYLFMKSVHYKLHSRTYNTFVFKESK